MKYFIFILFIFYSDILAQAQPTKLLMLISNGFDEISFSTSLNLLYKSGLSVEVVKVFENDENLTDIRVQSSSGGSFKAEFRFEKIIEKMKEYLMIIIPDGQKHCQTLVNNQDVIIYLKAHKAKNYWIAGIGASPALVLSKGNIIDQELLTCTPTEELQYYLKDKAKINQKVVVSDHIISGQNTGVVFEWVLTIVEKLQDLETAKKIANEIVFGYWVPNEQQEKEQEKELVQEQQKEQEKEQEKRQENEKEYEKQNEKEKKNEEL